MRNRQLNCRLLLLSPIVRLVIFMINRIMVIQIVPQRSICESIKIRGFLNRLFTVRACYFIGVTCLFWVYLSTHCTARVNTHCLNIPLQKPGNNVAMTYQHYNWDNYNRTSFMYKARGSVFNCTSFNLITKLKAQRIASFPPPPSATRNLEESSNRVNSFKEIFQKKIWQGQKAEENPEGLTGSGMGSTLAASARARQTLNAVIPMIKAFLGKERISMLDIPCGDMTWMPLVVSKRKDVDYTGMDIVPSLIASHQNHYRHYSHMKFVHGDIVADGIDGHYDLIFTREVTQHLKNADGLRIFSHFSNSSSEFLLATRVSGKKE